jgi:hypothetical protein
MTGLNDGFRRKFGRAASLYRGGLHEDFSFEVMGSV